MRNLLKAEFLKIKKDKAILIILIIIVALSALSTLFYIFLNPIMEGSIIIGDEEVPINLAYGGKTLFLNSLSYANNIGMIIPIIICIVACKEFSYGTIRNKVISGHKKYKIYLSMVISALVVGLGLYFINMVCNLLFGSIFLGYSDIDAFTGKEFLFILKTMGLSLLGYSFMIIATVFIIMLFKNVGGSIVVCIGFTLALALLSTLYALPLGSYQEVAELICSFNPIYQISEIIQQKDDWILILKMIGSTIVYSGVLISLGIVLFNKKDLK